MTYAWTQEQRKLLTYGSTVETDRERITPELGISVACVGPSGELVALLAHEPSPVGIEYFDPSTLKPPTIEFIRELARERLGSDAHVEEQTWCSDVASERVLVVAWKPGKAGLRGHQLVVHDERGSVDRFRAAVAAIVALAGAGLGGGR